MPVCYDHVVKSTQMLRNPIGEFPMRSRRKHRSPPRIAAIRNKRHYFLVVWQRCHVQVHKLRNAFFEIASSLEQPERRKQRLHGMCSQQDEKRLDEQIGSDYSAIEIDAQDADGGLPWCL